MSLPTCKACGQSVLDDDVEDCPFCGASMKTGQPSKKAGAGAKPAPQAARPGAAKPAAKPAARPAPSSSRAAPPMGLDDDDDDFVPPPPDDDPFELEKKAAATVIQLRAAPAKGLSLKLVCPMCETVGYTTSKAHGQSVKCANPKCLVPVFTAPEAKKEAPPPPPPAPPRSKVPLIMGAFFTLIALGIAGAWYSGFFEGNAAIRPANPDDIRDLIVEDNPTPDVSPDKPAPDTKPSDPDSKAPPKDDPAARLKAAYDLLIDTSRDLPEERNKAISRAAAAEISALRGNIPEAREQLTQMLKRARNVDYYAIAPLTDIGWHELAAGRADAAAAVGKELEGPAKQLPPFGRETAEISPQLAAFYAAIGRMADAEATVGPTDDQAAFGPVTVPLVTSVANRTYDFETAAANESLLPWTAPRRVAVTRILLLHGQWDPALEWAKKASDVEVRTDCLVEWGKAAVNVPAGASSPIAKLQPVVADLPPAAKARVYAAMALAHAEELRSEPAQTMLATAREALGAVKTPDPMAIPATKQILDYNPVDPSALRQAAHAAAVIAQAEAALKEEAKASETLKTALAYARGIGPSLPATMAKLEAAEKNGEATQNALKSELKLRTADEARITFNNYRRQLGRLVDAARQRFVIQSRLLASLANTPLRNAVWEIAQEGDAEAGEDREPYLESSVPWELINSWWKGGDSAKANAVREATDAKGISVPAEVALASDLDALVAEGKAAAAGQSLEAGMADKVWKERWLLTTTARLTKAGKFETAHALLRGVKDPILRDSTLSATSALASRTGHADAVWNASQFKGIPLSDRAVLYRGFLVGQIPKAQPK
ncbi:MAG: hypothetical protein IT428_14125 [Planctomycetaceae bacterium]|nr:hypothetical protein [Planctomycetaceae bacterium]